MTGVSTSRSERGGVVLPLSPWLLAAGATLLAALLLRVVAQTNADVSWLIELGERTLDGAGFYKDFFEVNPPASVLIYLPAVAVARVVGTSPEMMVDALAVLACGLSLAAAGQVLWRSGLVRRRDAGPLLCGALAVLLILPANAFAEREHVMLMALLCGLATLAARASGRQPGLWSVMIAGLGAGVAMSIKPIFVLALAGPAIYLGARRGWRSVMRTPELWIGGVLAALYGLWVMVFVPVYRDQILPVVLAVYVPARLHPLVLMVSPGLLIWVLLVFSTCRFRGRARRHDPAQAAGDPMDHDDLGSTRSETMNLTEYGDVEQDVAPRSVPTFRHGTPAGTWFGLGDLAAVLIVASIGLQAAFLIQGKNWAYQAYPALALAMLACVVQLLGRAATPDRDARAERLQLILVLGCFASSMLFCAKHTDARTANPGLAEAIAAVGPHPRMAALTRNMGLNFPLVRELGAIWAQSVPSTWISPNAARTVGSIEAAMADPVLGPLVRAEQDRFADDVARRHPDVLLVDGAFWPAWIASSPRVSRLFQGFTTAGTFGDVTLWVAKDRPAAAPEKAIP